MYVLIRLREAAGHSAPAGKGGGLWVEACVEDRAGQKWFVCEFTRISLVQLALLCVSHI